MYAKTATEDAKFFVFICSIVGTPNVLGVETDVNEVRTDDL